MKSKFKIGDKVIVNLPTGDTVGTVKYINNQDGLFLYSVNIKEPSGDSRGMTMMCNEKHMKLYDDNEVK